LAHLIPVTEDASGRTEGKKLRILSPYGVKTEWRRCTFLIMKMVDFY